MNDLFRLPHHVSHHLTDAFDGIDQPGILTERNRGIVDITSCARRCRLITDLAGVLAYGPFPS